MGADYVAMEVNTDIEFLQMAQKVYAHLSDETSKKIFEARCLFAMTGDVGAMTGLGAEYRNLGGDIEKYAKKLQKGSHCLIYGAGVAGHYLAMRFLRFGVTVDAFIESEEAKAGTDEATGIRIISEKELKDNKAIYGDMTVVVSFPVKPVADAIIKRLCNEVGIAESNIATGLYDWRNNASQYFDFFGPGENEVFVDCGCFDGGTCYRFAGWCGNKGYEQIYSFEADPANYEKCKALLEPLGKCELFPYGVSDKNEKVYFASKGFEDSCIISKEDAEIRNYEGVETIETVSLDEILKGKRITFLKMDVEGAEYKALLGAKKLIEECHPRMAISIYHKYEDFVTIPNLILEMNPDYRITFRHYGLDDLETIMYVE